MTFPPNCFKTGNNCVTAATAPGDPQRGSGARDSAPVGLRAPLLPCEGEGGVYCWIALAGAGAAGAGCPLSAK